MESPCFEFPFPYGNLFPCEHVEHVFYYLYLHSDWHVVICGKTHSPTASLYQITDCVITFNTRQGLYMTHYKDPFDSRGSFLHVSFIVAWLGLCTDAKSECGFGTQKAPLGPFVCHMS